MSVDRKILQWLETEIFEGNISLGEDLPDDRRIATTIRSSHSSTREALKRLENMGVLRLYEGRRKTIIPRLVSSPAAAAAPALRLHMAQARYPVRDMIQTRIMIESWALEHADPESPAMFELRDLAARMSEHGVLPAEFHRLEVQFHIALTKLAGNHLLTGLMASLGDSMNEYLFSLMGKVPLWSSTATRLRAEHQAIIDAVDSGDGQLAKQLVVASIEQQYIEAGIDLDEATGVANEMPGTVAAMEPVDIDTEDLVPDNWNEAASPALIAALENISASTAARGAQQTEVPAGHQTAESDPPLGAEPSHLDELDPDHRADDTPSARSEQPGFSNSHEDSSSDPAPYTVPGPGSGDRPEDGAGPAEEDGPARDREAVPGETVPEFTPLARQREIREDSTPAAELARRAGHVVRAPQTSRGKSRRRGTVSSPVHATVIKPIIRSGRPSPTESTGTVPAVSIPATGEGRHENRAEPVEVEPQEVPAGAGRTEQTRTQVPAGSREDTVQYRGGRLGRWLGLTRPVAAAPNTATPGPATEQVPEVTGRLDPGEVDRLEAARIQRLEALTGAESYGVPPASDSNRGTEEK